MRESKIHTPSKSFPRLVIERSKMFPGEVKGFLQMDGMSKRIELGSSEGREFRLVQCLFSPKNFMSAKYEPVVQTHERVFGAIAVGRDALNTRLADPQSMEREMTTIVEKSLRILQTGEVGKYFSFISGEGKVRMARVA